MSRIIILSNDTKYTYNFRKELINCIARDNNDIILLANFSTHIEDLQALGVKLIKTNIDRRGKNIFKDARLFLFYLKAIKKYKPDIVLSYTIKPNIYGGILTRIFKIPLISNVTGLGSAFEMRGLSKKLLTALYRFSLSKASAVMFQNNENMSYLTLDGKFKMNSILIPGSGVNLCKFRFHPYPDDEKINLIFVGRVMKSKGIDYFLKLAKDIKVNNDYVNFHIYGGYEENYEQILLKYENEGLIEYHGNIDNITDAYKFAHCVIHPTLYPEGMSNVLLEAAAVGRPLITTNKSGCKEVIMEGINGFLIKEGDYNDLLLKVGEFIHLPYNDKVEMGIQSRKLVESKFDRNIVVNAYLKEIGNVLNEKNVE